MILTLTALDLCAKKYDKGNLDRFDHIHPANIDTLEEDQKDQIAKELIRNDMVILTDDDLHLSALGQHILNMMLEPEILIKLNNERISLELKIYIKNDYYLSVMNQSNESDYANEKLTITFLPTLKQVVGAFAFAVNGEDEEKRKAESNTDKGMYDVKASLTAWNEERMPTSSMLIQGCFQSQGVRYVLEKEKKPHREEIDEGVCNKSDFINMLTEWMLGSISDNLNERRI